MPLLPAPLPCPFCGDEGHLFQMPEDDAEEHPNWRWSRPGWWVVGCHTALCHGNINNWTMEYPTKEKALKYWNKRDMRP